MESNVAVVIGTNSEGVAISATLLKGNRKLGSLRLKGNQVITNLKKHNNHEKKVGVEKKNKKRHENTALWGKVNSNYLGLMEESKSDYSVITKIDGLEALLLHKILQSGQFVVLHYGSKTLKREFANMEEIKDYICTENTDCIVNTISTEDVA